MTIGGAAVTGRLIVAVLNNPAGSEAFTTNVAQMRVTNEHAAEKTVS
jgi:hypothetical protein